MRPSPGAEPQHDSENQNEGASLHGLVTRGLIRIDGLNISCFERRIRAGGLLPGPDEPDTQAGQEQDRHKRNRQRRPAKGCVNSLEKVPPPGGLAPGFRQRDSPPDSLLKTRR